MFGLTKTQNRELFIEEGRANLLEQVMLQYPFLNKNREFSEAFFY